MVDLGKSAMTLLYKRKEVKGGYHGGLIASAKLAEETLPSRGQTFCAWHSPFPPAGLMWDDTLVCVIAFLSARVCDCSASLGFVG